MKIKMHKQLVNILFATISEMLTIIFVSSLISEVVGQSPSFKTTPQAVTEVEEGDVVTLYCDVNSLGTGLYNVSWLRDNKIISRNDEVLVNPAHYSVENDEKSGKNHLTITKVKREDAHYQYKCAVYKNEEIILILEVPATIKVLALPQAKYPICDALNNGYKENSEITVTCRVEIINPEVSIKWEKNGTEVDGAKSKIENGEQVLRYSFIAKQSDSGSLLKCVMHVTQTGEENHCTPGQLNILYKPKIQIHLPDTVSVGKEAVYICLATANPEITRHTWNVPASLMNRDFSSANGVLRITPKPQDNMTQISCTAGNTIGNVTKRITLRIQKSNIPNRLKEPEQSYEYVDENSAVSLFAIVLVAVGCSSLILLLMVIPVCYYYTCQRQEESLYMPRRPPLMVQPDVYSEPKDMALSDRNQNRTLPMLPSGTVLGKWKRSVGVQVPLEIEIEDVYAHVEGEVGSVKLSRVRSTKSEYV